MSELDELAQVRRDLDELVRLQESSVLYFSRPATTGSDGKAGPGAFYRTVEDRKAGGSPIGSRLTTTITCLESLLEMPKWLVRSEAAQPDQLLSRLENFMSGHLNNVNVSDVWKSDDAAWVYCRVRALGSYLRLSEAVSAPDYAHRLQVEQRAAEAWLSRFAGGASFGIREATEDVSTDAFKAKKQVEKSDQQYPPNAYLTYWGLLTRRGLKRCRPELEPLSEPLSEEADKAAHEWLVENLAMQVTFHYNNSALADPQQLLWSICGLVRFADGEALDNARSAAHELLVAGLRAFFEQMRGNGDWDTGAPLFHYKNAGNAYSYIYETLGEIFSLACAGPSQVHPDAAAALRREMRRHWPKIRVMLDRTRELGQHIDPSVTVWSSGHHPHRSAESWATASTFRFLQSLRRVVGIWCSEETKLALGARKPRQGLSELVAKGDTWDTGHGSVGLYLRLAFLWPLERQVSGTPKTPAERLFGNDPDQPILEGDDHARSAILFGPPGTGKTTLVEALAGALGWDFIEVTPARFIDEGVDHVSARADHIFRQIMEVDRCVVLLDEIDELIQLRGVETDPLERFFTTTMLPRLAALWALGRVLFFVNTNDIERVDTAIRRSQRFDAALFVLPPSYRVKSAMLKGLVPFTEADANKELTRAVSGEAPPAEASNYMSVNCGWFALMRFDQIQTYSAKFSVARSRALAPGETDGTRDYRAGGEALGVVARELKQLDWLVPGRRNDDGSTPGPSTESVAALPRALGRMLTSERRDARRQLVWRLAGTEPDTRTGPVEYEVVPTGTEHPERWAESRSFRIEPRTGYLVTDAETAVPVHGDTETEESVEDA